jgi:hypothetical protein
VLGQLHTVLGQETGRSTKSDENRHERGHHGNSGDRGHDWRGGDSRHQDRPSGSSQSSNTSSKSSASGSLNTPSKPKSDAKPSSSAAESALSTKTWATSFVKEHDKNKNGWLDGDELKDYHGKPEAINKDGVITVDSLAAAASSVATSSATASTAPSTAGSTAAEHAKSDPDMSKRVLVGSAGGLQGDDKRHSYRFTPADERLPSGLPSWFKDKDTNSDGQIEMSEYARSWTNSTAADFQRYDLNGDGIITAKEAGTKPAPKGG